MSQVAMFFGVENMEGMKQVACRSPYYLRVTDMSPSWIATRLSGYHTNDFKLTYIPTRSWRCTPYILHTYHIRNISITHIIYYSFLYGFVFTYSLFTAQTLDQADHGKGQLHRTYQGHDVGRTWKKHLHLSKTNEIFPGGCTYTAKYTMHLYFGKKTLCSYSISYPKRKEQWFDEREVPRWNWDAYVLAS